MKGAGGLPGAENAVGLIILAGVANSAAVWLIVRLSSPGADIVLSISR